MEQLIHTKVVVQAGGKIVLDATGLRPGAVAEVVIRCHETGPHPSYRSLFGSGTGGFATPEEALTFLSDL